MFTPANWQELDVKRPRSGERGREEQPGRDLGIAALRNETAKAPMPDELLLHLARGARRRRIDRWPSERDESHQTSRREGNQNQRH